MAKLAFLAVMVLLVTALVASSPARATDVRPCPAPPLTVDELLALAGDAGYAGFAGQLNPDGLACYGASDVMVVGFVHEPDGLGGTGAVVIEPTWLTEWGLFLPWCCSLPRASASSPGSSGRRAGAWDRNAPVGDRGVGLIR